MSPAEEVLRLLRAWVEESHPEVSTWEHAEFAEGSLRQMGVDSLELVELAVRLAATTGRELDDAFLASSDLDVPSRWCDAATGPTTPAGPVTEEEIA